MIELICDNCEKIFQRTRDRKRKHKFCCKECLNIWYKSKAKINKCEFCGKDTKNPKFCCKSCAASYNNKEFPKRNKENKDKKIKINFCKICGVQIKYRSKYCIEHNPQYVNWTKITLGDVVYESDQVKSNRYSRIRDNVRRIYASSGRPQECAHCGYSKHFEICHIKPIRMFDLTDTISTINSLDNLIALCPNCHWEFDNGLIPVLAGGFEPKKPI